MPSTQWIVQQRGPKNRVDPTVPYLSLVEDERSADGILEQVLTVFLTNRECPFHCTMCDLWKNTTDETVPQGAITGQVDWAIERFDQERTAQVIKLYNSGNWFDRQAIPREDWPAIAERIRHYRAVIVETHPKLLEGVREFAELIHPAQLEVAMGLETVHPDVLPKLNKQMTVDDFHDASQTLVAAGIGVRAFILLQPPWIVPEEAVEWALRSIEFAFDAGVECCSIVPTREGNGAMEQLLQAGQFQRPSVDSMLAVLLQGLALGRGRVFMDVWDIEKFATDANDLHRRQRIEQLNRQGLSAT